MWRRQVLVVRCMRVFDAMMQACHRDMQACAGKGCRSSWVADRPLGEIRYPLLLQLKIILHPVKVLLRSLMMCVCALGFFHYEYIILHKSMAQREKYIPLQGMRTSWVWQQASLVSAVARWLEAKR